MSSSMNVHSADLHKDAVHLLTSALVMEEQQIKGTISQQRIYNHVLKTLVEEYGSPETWKGDERLTSLKNTLIDLSNKGRGLDSEELTNLAYDIEGLSRLLNNNANNLTKKKIQPKDADDKLFDQPVSGEGDELLDEAREAMAIKPKVHDQVIRAAQRKQRKEEEANEEAVLEAEVKERGGFPTSWQSYGGGGGEAYPSRRTF